ncbi:hypothetical protein Patl1_00546 [Pistacia atlantica]|uniref:Uncharacterized protein n=1 Tax=Pistacia atlantica TaxID=434234 RepID=A0ACC1C6Q3_9ROSI|nr:hypothetical protein Patl1_00546 [Pistacia atlantica]
MYGCLLSYKKAVVDYNNMLKQTLDQIRKDLPKANLIYVDLHSIFLDLFRHPTAYGLTYGPKACCGLGGGAYNFDVGVFCGISKAILNGSLFDPPFPINKLCDLHPIA